MSQIPVMAAPRDASWRKNPGTGRRYHIAVPHPKHDTLLTAACDRHTWLSSSAQCAVTEVGVPLRCQRRGCKSRWPAPLPFPGGETFSVADLRAFSLNWDMVGWAEHVLNDYDLADWDWLVHSLAQSMEDAAFDAYESWVRDHEAELQQTCHLPRPCPCVKWPDFGTGCYYHGPCKCVKRKDNGTAALRYHIEPEWRRYSQRFPPTLDKGCPVHPDGQIPDDVLERYDSSYPFRISDKPVVRRF
jgi:hypothetical protein